jgi:effector-binding domain-containing protein
MAFAREHGLTPTGPGWECYLTGPDEPGPPVTEIFWPVS